MHKSYSESEIRANYEKLTKFLIKNHLTITTMESATAGQIASLITDTEGSSAVLKGAFGEIIEEHSVYSRETAAAMAMACLEAYQADIGIGVTGTMGNTDPANAEASVPGQVYFAIATRRSSIAENGSECATRRSDVNVETYYREIAPQPTRLMYKLAVAEEVYEALLPE